MQWGLQVLNNQGKKAAAAPAFLPTSITGCIGWYDGADGSTITQSGGDVSQWNDKSTSSNNATQSTAADQPVFTASSINGNSALVFNGTSDFMNLATGDPFLNSTIFIAAKVPSGSTHGTFTGNPSGYLFGLNSGTLIFYNGGVSPSYNYTPDGSQHTFALTAPSGNNQLYIDGSSVATGGGTASTNVTTLGVRQGNVDYLSGALGEVIIYNNVLSATNFNLVQAYLKSKWGTP